MNNLEVLTSFFLNRNTRFVLLYFCLILLSACESKDTPNSIDSSKRTVLVYIAGDDADLSSYAQKNLEDIVASVAKSNTYGTLLCYFDNFETEPVLYKIDKFAKGGKIELKRYAEQKSASIESLSEAVKDMEYYAPAQEYGLVLWGHGSGWDPKIQTARTMQHKMIGFDRPLQYSYGGSQDGWMDIEEIRDAIPDRLFHFILFDACYMSQIEVAYTLRNKANYMIASAAETLATGFPYKDIVPLMLDEDLDLSNICEAFYQFYSLEFGARKTATVALVNLQYMESFAEWNRSIFRENYLKLVSLSNTEVQYFDRMWPVMMFDYGQTIRLIASHKVGELNEWLKKVIEYKAATPKILNTITINPVNFCGITTYIPFDANDYRKKNLLYRNTDWYRAVYE